MKLTGCNSLATMAACAVFVLPLNIQAQTATPAERMAAIRSQQMARSAMIARQKAAQNGGVSANTTAQRAAAQRAAAAQRSRTRAPSTQPSMRRATSGVKPAASGASLVSMRTALNAFAMDMGRMPTAAEGLGALLKPPPGAKNWRGPYISSVNWRQALTDPWGNPYRYFVTGTGRYQQHTISSDGPDRTMGTADDLKVQF